MARYYRIDVENEVIYANFLKLEEDEKEYKEVEVFQKRGYKVKYEDVKPKPRKTTKVSYEAIIEFLEKEENKDRLNQALKLKQEQEERKDKNGESIKDKNGEPIKVKKGKNGVISWFLQNYPDDYKALKEAKHGTEN